MAMFQEQPVTPQLLTALDELASRAARTPYEIEESFVFNDAVPCVDRTVASIHSILASVDLSIEDAEYLVAACNAERALTAEVRRLAPLARLGQLVTEIIHSSFMDSPCNTLYAAAVYGTPRCAGQSLDDNSHRSSAVADILTAVAHLAAAGTISLEEALAQQCKGQ